MVHTDWSRCGNATRIFDFQCPLVLILFQSSEGLKNFELFGVHSLQNFFPLMVLFAFTIEESRRVAKSLPVCMSLKT